MSESMKTIKVPEWYHEQIEAEKADDETFWQALVRMSGGPSPEQVAGILSDETAEGMEEMLEKQKAVDVENQENLVDEFGDG